MRDITLCHPRLQELAGELLRECSAQGLAIQIGETLRTVERRVKKFKSWVYTNSYKFEMFWVKPLQCFKSF